MESNLRSGKYNDIEKIKAQEQGTNKVKMCTRARYKQIENVNFNP